MSIRDSMEPPDTTDPPSRSEVHSREVTPPRAAQTEEAVEERGEPSTSAALVPSTSSSISRTTSRSQESTKSRRSTRRASLDPYPAQREGSTEAAKPSSRTTRSNAVTEEGEETREEEAAIEGEETEMEEVVAQPEGRVEPDLAKERSFELKVMQQPEIGAEAGLGKVTLGRLPIVPAPVVQLIVKDSNGNLTDVDLPYLFCSCSLRDATGSSPIDLAQSNGEEVSALIGNLVRNPHRVEDLDGNTVSAFVFEDMSVRIQGKFTLEFRLGEARRPKSPRLAAVVSDPFDVVEWKNYPGRPVADTVPELSLHLHNQGVPMYIPPLLLSQPSDNPPPPSSNPFPSDHLSQTGSAQQSEAGDEGGTPPVASGSSSRE
ncbi:hypothetical protein JCM5353_004930 [Sporobolomyces roseus]